MSLAERLAQFDFEHADVNMYNILLELISTRTARECEEIINERICDEQNRAFMLAELARFYNVASLIETKIKSSA